MDDVREQALAEAKRTYAGFITFLKWISFIFIALIKLLIAFVGSLLSRYAMPKLFNVWASYEFSASAFLKFSIDSSSLPVILSKIPKFE